MTNCIKDTIIRVNGNIFSYKLKDLPVDLYSIMDGVNSKIKAVKNMDINEINTIFKVMINALESKDYLLIADILKFELLPIVELIETDINY